MLIGDRDHGASELYASKPSVILCRVLLIHNILTLPVSKHGCDYKGYGLASRLPRLDLSAFQKERLQDRKGPIVQQFCIICQSPEEELIPCEGGCSRAYHTYCHPNTTTIKIGTSWYCSSVCLENKQKNKVGKV